MLFTRKKITTIVDELTTFFFSVGSDDMVVNIKQKPEGFHIFFASNFDVKMQKTVEHLEENLTRGRAPEIEESYWGLNGSGDFQDENELILIGAMIAGPKARSSSTWPTPCRTCRSSSRTSSRAKASRDCTAT